MAGGDAPVGQAARSVGSAQTDDTIPDQSPCVAGDRQQQQQEGNIVKAKSL